MTHTPKFGADVISEAKPSVGVNLGGSQDYREPRFLDRARHMRPWWEENITANVIDDQYKDSDGNVVTLPPNTDWYQSIWAADISDATNGAYRGGDFTVTWEGEAADVNISATQSAVSNLVKDISNNSVTFTASFTTASNAVFYIDVTPANIEAIPSTNPRALTNPPKNFKIIKNSDQTAYDNGEVILPNVRQDIQDMACFRFMDWTSTNSSPETTWANRRPLTHQRWATLVPWEALISFCNTADVPPWFCIPHGADDDYVTQLGTLVASTLNSNLIPRFEWSNELWNATIGTQYAYCFAGALADWGSNDGTKWLEWQSKRSTECMGLLATSFGSRPFIGVLGTHTATPSRTDNVCNPTFWAAQEPGTYVDPTTVHDELAVTTYYGSSVMSTNDAALASDYTANGKASVEAMIVSLADTAADTTISNIQSHASKAEGYGLTLVGYECNHHLNWDGNGSDLALAGYTEAEFIEFCQTSTALDAVSEKVRDAFKAAGGTLMCLFVDVEASKWGARRYVGDTGGAQWNGWKAWSDANPRWWIDGKY